MQIKVSNQEVASGRVDSLSNIGADVQYFGPLFACLTQLSWLSRYGRVRAQPVLPLDRV